MIGSDEGDFIVKMRVTGHIAILMPNQVKKLELRPQPPPQQPGPSNQSGEEEEVDNEFEAGDSDDEVVGEDSEGGESIDEGVSITSLKTNGS